MGKKKVRKSFFPISSTFSFPFPSFENEKKGGKKLYSPCRDRRRDQPQPQQRHQLVGAPVRLLPPDQRRLDEAQGQL